MGLDDIAAGVETTTRQRDRGVAAVDRRERSLRERLADYDEALPCTPAAAATVHETYAGGASVGEAADAAGVAPVTAAKALHRLGVEGVCPLAPTARQVVRDWLAADLTRAEALELTGGDEAAFALATYVETHDPVPGARAAVETGAEDAMVEKRNALAGAMSDPDELF